VTFIDEGKRRRRRRNNRLIRPAPLLPFPYATVTRYMSDGLPSLWATFHKTRNLQEQRVTDNRRHYILRN